MRYYLIGPIIMYSFVSSAGFGLICGFAQLFTAFFSSFTHDPEFTSPLLHYPYIQVVISFFTIGVPSQQIPQCVFSFSFWVFYRITIYQNNDCCLYMPVLLGIQPLVYTNQCQHRTIGNRIHSIIPIHIITKITYRLLLVHTTYPRLIFNIYKITKNCWLEVNMKISFGS